MPTQLEAVNRMLLAVREQPLNTLQEVDEAGSIAVALLDQVRRDVLMSGWKFNTDFDVTFTPDGDTAEIRMSSNVLRVIWDVATNTTAVDPVVRGVKVYDAKNGVYTFTRNLKAKQVIRSLSWDELPPTAQAYIAARAATLMAGQETADQQLVQSAAREEFACRREMIRDYGFNSRPNLLNSPGVAPLAYRTTTWL